MVKENTKYKKVDKNKQAKSETKKLDIMFICGLIFTALLLLLIGALRIHNVISMNLASFICYTSMIIFSIFAITLGRIKNKKERQKNKNRES